MNNYSAAILATGGMDSTVLMYRAVEDKKLEHVHVVTVDYGQKAHERELELLRKHCRTLGLPEPVVLREHFDHAKPGLFTPGYQMQKQMTPDGADNPDKNEMKYSELFVEGRNAFIALRALAWCSANKVDELWTGFVNNQHTWDNQRSHFSLYTNDSSPHFVEAINLLALTGFSHYVRLVAPFLNERADKRDVYREAVSYGINVAEDTHSCYFDVPCGTCLSCQMRAKLLAH